jgi:homoserine kinase
LRKRVTVLVPATSGNIGPGFDVLGLALNWQNELRVEVLKAVSGPPEIVVQGEGENTLPRDSRNIIFKTMAGVFSKAKRRVPRLKLICFNRIPLARGLGSSAAAYLSALLAANRLLNDRFGLEQILDWAAEMEGHPDNVAPALFGGVCASGLFEGGVVSVQLPIPTVRLVAVIPDFELSTKRARAVLPRYIPLKDAVFNLSAVALLPFALSGQGHLLKYILNDRWHEPYRAKLIPGFSLVKEAALKAGALGVTLSGAGPTMLGFAAKTNVARVGHVMRKAFETSGIRSFVKEVSVNRTGALVR